MEVMLLFVLVLILFGPRKLPDVARMIGRAISDLRRASSDFRDQVMSINKDINESIFEELEDTKDKNENSKEP